MNLQVIPKLRGIFCGIQLSQDRVDALMPTVRKQTHGCLDAVLGRCPKYAVIWL